MRASIIVAACLWIACGDSDAQMYRWVDDQGRVHYTQTPPPPQAKDVQRKDFRQGATADTSDLPYATQLAAKNYPVTLYTQADCGPPCEAARASLVKRGVPFREVTVASQKEIEEVKRVSGGERVPLLVVGSQFQVGFQESLYQSLLDTAGYPPAGQRIPIEALRKVEPAPSPARAQPQQAEGQVPGESK